MLGENAGGNQSLGAAKNRIVEGITIKQRLHCTDLCLTVNNDSFVFYSFFHRQ